ncbi:glucosaminidase domain-containing protein [Clostridia bacterium]|nr:glucosaminidase domain-containing protein [Clostridia bacterium]
MQYKFWGLPFVLLLLCVFMLMPAPAFAQVSLIIDGEEITSEPVLLVDGRTMVPLRVVSEELGASVNWIGDLKKIELVNGTKTADMRIGDHLASYDQEQGVYEVIDVAPQLIGTGMEAKTYVPLRLVSNALGVAIDWDGDQKQVLVDSSSPATVVPYFQFGFSGVDFGEKIEGRRSLRLVDADEYIGKATQVRFLLLDPATHKGVVVAAGTDLDAAYLWLPDPLVTGEKLLVAGLYDADGNYIAGMTKQVNMAPVPSVEIQGLSQGSVITGSTELSVKLNCLASYVKYQFTNETTGKNWLTDKVDPYGTYTFTPDTADNGDTLVTAIAYNQDDEGVLSEPVSIQVSATRYLTLAGVSANQTIEGPVKLVAKRNFSVSKTQYVMLDLDTGKETILKELGYGSYTWNVSPGMSGNVELFVRVYDVNEKPVEGKHIPVVLAGKPNVTLSGVGPDAVVSSDVELKLSSNVELINPTFRMTKIGSDSTYDYAVNSEGVWTLNPDNYRDGSWSVYAYGTYEGKTIKSDVVSFKIYNGTTYSSKPLVPKSEFLGVVTDLAIDSRNKTGMSASLQVAQAILETGWGQYIPVDKYNGKFSYNLFGIKGSAVGGSVVSNTWEEYNGVSFRTDANFRAYYNVEQSWADHKRILLELSRYQIYRDVMYNPVLGAYAVRRAGYATDSLYPQKLINIIEQYDLWSLDEVGI